MWEYIFFVSEKHTHKLKYFHWRIYSYEFTFLPLQTKKDRTLCFSNKKSAVRVVFWQKSFNLIISFFLRPPGWRFFSSPAFLVTRVLFFWPHWSEFLKQLLLITFGNCFWYHKCFHLFLSFNFTFFSVVEYTTFNKIYYANQEIAGKNQSISTKQ